MSRRVNNPNPWDSQPTTDPWQATGDPWKATASDPWTSDENIVPGSASPNAEMYSYSKVKQIGEPGGQGEVWLVEREGSSIQYAQKFLLPTGGSDDVKRFHREVRIQSTLDHPGIMPIHAVNFDASPPWFVMPLADHSLRWLLKQQGTLDEDDTVDILLQVAAALGHAHAEGIIHRDIKPENVLFLDGRWVVTDFGLCRDWTADSTTVTKTGTALGTLPYMAPEQWTDPHNVGAPADVFAIGRVMYECLTGQYPWPNVRHELVPDRFKYIFTKCEAYEADKRYATVDALVSDLKALSTPDDLALPIEHAQALAGRVAARDVRAVEELVSFILRNLSDEVFLRTFLPSVTPPVLAALRRHNTAAFHQIVKAFDQVAAGGQAFSWTDTAATFLERVFSISPEAEIRDLVLRRLLVLGTEHNRWAVRTVYMGIISRLTAPEDVLLVARHLSEYPAGAEFVRPAAEGVSLPLRIQRALDAA